MSTGLNERTRQRRIVRWLQAVKIRRGCCICGYRTYTGALEFHHIDPDTKERELTQAKTLRTALREVVKCAVLCANCHREVHAGLIRDLRPVVLMPDEVELLTPRRRGTKPGEKRGKYKKA